MQDIDISLLRTFKSLAETRNFTKTAVHVHRTQSAVSMQVSKIENILGCKVLKRNRRNVELTHEGKKLLFYANEIIQISDNLIDYFSESEIEGQINFGSPEDFTNFYLPKILSEFATLHPKIALNVNCDLTPKLIRHFEKKEYDVVIIKQEPENMYSNADLLWKEKLVWVGNSDEPQKTSFDKITDHYHKTNQAFPLVLSPAPCIYRQRMTMALDKMNIPWKAAYASPSFVGSVAAVKAGLGYTIFPEYMVPNSLIPYNKKTDWPELKDTATCLLTNKDVTPAIQTLVSTIKQKMSVIHKLGLFTLFLPLLLFNYE